MKLYKLEPRYVYEVEFDGDKTAIGQIEAEPCNEPNGVDVFATFEEATEAAASYLRSEINEWTSALNDLKYDLSLLKKRVRDHRRTLNTVAQSESFFEYTRECSKGRPTGIRRF